MQDEFQGGKNNLINDFYQQVFPYIKNNSSILNLGSGIKFNFEKEILKEKRVEITSLDVLPIDNKPDFLKKYINQSVEAPFLLDEKFDYVTFFELIEHIDKTDILIKNAFHNLKPEGRLILSFPNLASIYSRIELVLGFQPHVLEVSNESPYFGAGSFGKFNSSDGKTIHHLRGITYRAMKEMLTYHGFEVEKTWGYDFRFKRAFRCFPGIASIIILVCHKIDK